MHPEYYAYSIVDYKHTINQLISIEICWIWWRMVSVRTWLLDIRIENRTFLSRRHTNHQRHNRRRTKGEKTLVSALAVFYTRWNTSATISLNNAFIKTNWWLFWIFPAVQRLITFWNNVPCKLQRSRCTVA